MVIVKIQEVTVNQSGRWVVETVLTMPTVKNKDQLVLLRVKIEATSVYCLLESGQSFEYRYTRL